MRDPAEVREPAAIVVALGPGSRTLWKLSGILTYLQRCLRAVHASHTGDPFHTSGAPSGECGTAVMQTIPSHPVPAPWTLKPPFLERREKSHSTACSFLLLAWGRKGQGQGWSVPHSNLLHHFRPSGNLDTLACERLGATPCKLGVFRFLLSGFLLGGKLNRCDTTLIAPRQIERFVAAVFSLSSFKELPVAE